jgi:hypothetical protein
MYGQDMAFSTRALVLMKVTGSLPSTPVPPASKWKHLVGPKLADPKFNILGPEDILPSADIFGKLMQPGRVIRTYNSPTAMKTVLGWVLTGQTDNTVHSTSLATHLVQCNMDVLLQRFWTFEEVSSMLFREMITVYSKNHMKPINALCGQNVELMNIKASDIYSYH